MPSVNADIEVDVLVIGAGPAGASMAALLATYGVQVMAVSKHPRTAQTPRAHITNQRAMEVMRDLGLEQTCLLHSSSAETMGQTFWMRSMAGREYARAWSWGVDPQRKGEYETASPCRMSDLPQSLLEPMLVEAATDRGAKVRFDTELMSFQQDEQGVDAMLKDRLTGREYRVRAKYMIGADGGRSVVVEQLGIPLTGTHDLAQAYNIYCQVDLTQYVAHRPGALYWIFDPEAPPWAFVSNFRMVRTWNQWLVTFISADKDAPLPPVDEVVEYLRTLIGDRSLPIDVHSVSRWTINDIVADRYSVGRVHCMGDAVHRHPPGNGLGSNTSIQDAYNLAWKLAYVLKGLAQPSLLASYDTERRPVGRQIVTRANKSMDQSVIWDLLGVRPDLNPAERAERLRKLALPGADGAERRAALRQAMIDRQYELHAHGVELNQRYESSAIVGDGTSEPEFARDAELFYQPSTRPGAHLPHAWLGKGGGRDPQVSTLDLAGHGAFTLFASVDAEPWLRAVEVLSRELNLESRLRCVRIGVDFQDLYGDWARLCGIEENGCLLVRPDMFVAWRCPSAPVDCTAALRDVLHRMLGRGR